MEAVPLADPVAVLPEYDPKKLLKAFKKVWHHPASFYYS